MRALLVCACASLTAPLAAGCEDDPPPADAAPADAPDAPATPPFLRDARGGALVLRGTNVSGEAKTRPDFLPPYGEADFARLRDEVGVSAIRLLVFWEAIEPAPGAYDARYLAAVRRLVDEAGRADVRVLVDMHQDVYGRGFAQAGAPRWTCDEALYASFQRPAEWYLGYVTREVSTCFDRLWAPGPVRAAFAGAWRRLATELRGAPAVVAYELVNEPWWGTRSPREFDQTIAPDVYATLTDAVREGDPDAWVAIEPATTASLGVATALVPPARPRLVYAPHVYPVAIERGPGYDGDAARLRAHITQVRRDATRLGLPVVVGEVGVRRDLARAADYLRDAFDAFDAEMMGALQWDLGRGDESSYALWTRDGAPSPLARAVARPYPRRVAGTPLGWRWDRAAGVFTAAWREDGPAGDTEVMVPSLAFPDGATWQVDDGPPAAVTGTVLRIPPRGGARALVVRARGR